MSTTGKRLIVFCDATSSDGLLTVGNGKRTLQVALNKQYATNVLRLSRFVNRANKKQIVLYHSGIATEADFDGNEIGGISTTSGTVVASKIRDIYNFLAQNFGEDDEICMFGFERGAYIVLKVAGLIDKIGLLQTKDMGLFFTLWLDLYNQKPVNPPAKTRMVPIKCLGLWDTVGRIYNAVDVLSIKDNHLPRCVKYAFHALSLQENGEWLTPTLLFSPAIYSDQELIQMWFPGSQQDVGGGFPDHSLSDLSLFWMAGEIVKRGLIDLNMDALAASKQPTIIPWGKARPHNNYYDTFPCVGSASIDCLDSDYAWTCATRISLITRTDKFHQSVLQSPKHGELGAYGNTIITLEDVKSRFPDWTGPATIELNDFEQRMKDGWLVQLNLEAPTVIHEAMQSDLFPDGDLLWVAGIPGLVPTNEIVQGGIAEDGSQIYVARVPYQDGGLYPGKAGPHCNNGDGANIVYNGKEIIKQKPYQLLTGPVSAYRWVSREGPLNVGELGANPVKAGYDPSHSVVLYVAKANVDQAIHCGMVREGAVAQIPWGGVGKSILPYSVLVYSNSDQEHVQIGSFTYSTKNPPANIKSDPRTFNLSTMSIPPSVVLGINTLDMAKHSDRNHALQIKTSMLEVTSTKFTTQIETYGGSRLYEVGVDWFVTDIAEIQCGRFDTKAVHDVDHPGMIVRRVNFPVAFKVAPRVFLALSGMDLSLYWSLHIFPSNIDNRGFTINLITPTGSHTKLWWATVDWIAFPETLHNISCGTFSSLNSGDDPKQNYALTGHTDFGIKFTRVPKIFTSINQFDVGNGANLRVRACATPFRVTETGMDWEIWSWSDTQINSVGVSYLAVDLKERRLGNN